MSRLRNDVEAECLRDAKLALEEIASSPYDPDRSSAQAALAEIEQKLAAPAAGVLVRLTVDQAKALVSQPKDVKPSDLGMARAPIRAALAAAEEVV